MKSRSTSFLALFLAVFLPAAGGYGQGYSYDPLGRLTDVRYDGAHTIQYRLDRLGNITNEAVSATRGETDDDADGMADAWELVWFNTFTNTAAGDFNGDTVDNLAHYLEQTDPITPDSDGDRFSNRDEVFADTDPTNGASFLGIIRVAPGSACGITFYCRDTRFYTLEYTTNAAGETWHPVGGQSRVPGEADGEMTLTDTTNTALRLYRVTVEQ